MSKEQNHTSPYKNTFFLLFVGALFISNTGTWLFTVGSSWLMTRLDSSALMVSLVQTATLFPMFLLALPAGAIGDIFSQKKVLIISQSLMIANTILFAFLVYQDQATSLLLLLFTFINGIGAAFSRPIISALIPQMVSKPQLRTAVSFTSIAFNLSRALGPILGGLLITTYAIDLPFWVDGFSFLLVISVMIFWKDKKTERHDLPREKIRFAIGDSIRFLRHTSALYLSIIRSILFFLPSAALWALLPLIAKQQLGGEADLYGYLLGASGFGAVSTIAFADYISDKLGANRLTLIASIILGLALAGLGFAPIKYIAMGVAFIAGVCWQLTFTSLMTSTQYALPQWFGTRGMSYFLMAMSVSMGVGSALWGFFADITGVDIAYYASGGLTILTAFLGKFFPLDLAKDGNFESASDLPELSFNVKEKADRGVMIRVVYTLGDADQDTALEKVSSIKNERYRNGALRWSVLSDPDDETKIIESYFQQSLAQYQRHRDRITQHDYEQIKEVEDWFKAQNGSVEIKRFLEARS